MNTSATKRQKHSNDDSSLAEQLGNLTINGPLEDVGVPTLSKDQNNISFNIVQAMCNRKTNKELFDCRIIVDEETFNCHSFVLQSCSEFFRNRLTPNLNDTPLKLTSIPASTFRVILDTLYSGDNPLTAHNIREMWPAVHLLKIDFLIKLCEDFVLTQLTLDNVTMYKRQADTLNSKRVLAGILQFISKHFSALRNSEIVLSMNMEDFKKLVASDDLVVESEDIVLQAIYEWVSSNENERKKFLVDLLKCTRYCLASKSCIGRLRKHPLSLNEPRVNEIFDVASAFKVDFMRGFWPTPAIHRNSVGFDHLGVYYNIDDNKFVHLSLKGNTVIDFTDIPALKSVKLTVANGKIFACKSTRSTGNVEVFALEKQQWRLICGFKLKTTPRDKSTVISMISHKKCLFIFSRNKMRSFNPNDKDVKIQESIHAIPDTQHVISLRSQILMFGSGENQKAVETTVHSWRTETKTWSHLVNLQFTAKDMTSFEDDSNWYILDPKGHFWKLTNSDTVVFTYIGKLWDATLTLKGALLFKETLFLFVERLELAADLNFKNELGRGIFQDVKYHKASVHMSNVVHLLKKTKKKSSAVMSVL